MRYDDFEIMSTRLLDWNIFYTFSVKKISGFSLLHIPFQSQMIPLSGIKVEWVSCRVVPERKCIVLYWNAASTDFRFWFSICEITIKPSQINKWSSERRCVSQFWEIIVPEQTYYLEEFFSNLNFRGTQSQLKERNIGTVWKVRTSPFKRYQYFSLIHFDSKENWDSKKFF